MMYIPEIRNKGDYRYVDLWVGEARVGSFFASEGLSEMLDNMYAKMIRQFLETEYDVSFYEEPEEEEDW